MIYIFDSSSLVEFMDHHSERSFPSLWADFRKLVSNGRIKSVKEVYNELLTYGGVNVCKVWAEENKHFFELPSEEETEFVTKIYVLAHFRNNIEQQKILAGGYHADPFIIAKAKLIDGCVITQETMKENAAKIPNICRHFLIKYADFDGFMEREGLYY